jgi:uroporphyrinogen decarboxylase
MNSKERVIRAVKFQDPDRIPVNLWYLQATKIKYGHKFEDLRLRYPEDFGDAGFEDLVEGSDLYKRGIHKDGWGCVWEGMVDGLLGQVIEPPLKDIRNLAHYKPPEFLKEREFRNVGETIKKNAGKFICAGAINLFHRIVWLRGFEETLVDLQDGSPEITVIRDIVFDFHMKRLKEWLKYDVEALGFGDDWGTQRQLFVSPAIWRNFIKPAYQEMFDLIKKSGRMIFFHSDGYIMEIMDDFVAMGVDALNSQVWCMGVEEIGRRYRGKICFWGEVDRQYILPRGGPKEVKNAIQEMKEHLMTEHGGLIGQGEAGPDVPLENIELLLNGWNNGN